MLIKHILSGRKKTDLILLKDCNNSSGFPVLKKIISEALLRNTAVHVLLTENLLFSLKEYEGLVIHKHFPDPWGLLDGRESDLSFEQIVDCILSERTLNPQVPILFVICSLSPLLQFINLESLCNSFKRLLQTNDGVSSSLQLLCLIHSEMFPEEKKEYRSLLYLATSLLSLSSSPPHPSQLRVEHRQSNGKILNEVYNLSLNPMNELQFDLKAEEQPMKVNEPEEQLVRSTFKLTLEEKEKHLKSQVVLPYLKASKNESKIFYEPDPNDDWDDEDPDDDLEI